MNRDELIENKIREKQNSIRYDLRSYPISVIVDKFRREEFYIPRYQRSLVWNKRNQARFIESIIMGLPTSLLFTVETNDGRLEIIDGAQRIRTIDSYANNNLILNNIEEIPVLNETRFGDLSLSQQNKFLNRIMNIIILSSETSLESRLEIFKRLNIRGLSKSAHQMRIVLMEGPLIDLVKQLAEHPLFNEIIHVSPFMKMRYEREDLILRFFALSDELNKLRNNMDSFLNSYIKKIDAQFERERLANEFEKTLHFISNYLGEVLYRRNKRIKYSLFLVIFVGANLALRQNSNLMPRRVGWIREVDLMMNPRSSVLHPTRRVKDGIYFVMDNLLNR